MSQKSPILITGAAKRVGLHLAETLMSDGYPVIAHYRSRNEAVERLAGQGAQLVQGALDTHEGVLSVVEQVLEHTGSLRAIIHNASSFTPTLREIGDDLFEQYQLFFGVHMVAPYVLNESLRPLLLKSKEGAADIIHITDINVRRPNPDYDIYCSTKAGLENLNVSFAKRFAPEIQVNSIAPGPILFPETHAEDDKTRILKATPLQKEGGAEAIYLAVRGLLENHFITGSSIVVDGGRSIVE